MSANGKKTTSLKDRSLAPTFDECVQKLRVQRRPSVPAHEQATPRGDFACGTGVTVRSRRTQATPSEGRTGVNQLAIDGEGLSGFVARGSTAHRRGDVPRTRSGESSPLGGQSSNRTTRTESVLHFLDVVIDGQRWEALPNSSTVLAWWGLVPDTFVSPNKEWLTVFGMYPVEGEGAGEPGSATLRSDADGRFVDPTLKFLRAVFEVLFDFDAKLGEILCSRPADVRALFKRVMSWPEADFVSNAKFFTVYPMARFLRQPLPPAPKPSYGYKGTVGSALLFQGAVRRYLKSRILGGRKSDVPLFLSLLQGVKRGCAVVNESYVRSAYEKHAAMLSREPKVPSPKMYAEISSKLATIWKGLKMGSDKLTEPSSSAALFTKRSQGGARGRIHADALAADVPYDRSRAPTSGARIFLPEDEQLFSMTETRPGVVESQRGPEFVRTYTQLRAIMPLEPNAMEVHAILEPLKVRLITKGPAWKMYHARKLQRALWGHLQDLPQFALTGRPLSVDDLKDLDTRTRALGLDFDQWVSGDYSAATDNLGIEYTKASMERALAGLSLAFGEADLYRDVLYEQELNYPKQSGVARVMQRNGQLMGSVLSFPHLCTINLSTYWSALEEYVGRPIPLALLPVLINGDDILFKANPRFYNIWLRWIAEVEFFLSLGKNYMHTNFLMINSEAWWYQNGVFTPFQFHNVGLLTGQSKVSGRTQQRLAPVWDYYNQVMAGAADRPRAHRRFLQLNRELIDKLTLRGQYSLFIDRRYGGLGFDLYPEVKPSVGFTAFQRKFGNFLRKELKDVTGQYSKVAKTALGIVREEKGVASVMRYHYGHYSLQEYTNVGSLDRPLFTLVLAEGEETLPRETGVTSPMLKGVSPGENTSKVVHPSRGTLRRFRASLDPHFTSIGKLLQAERVYVERKPRLLEHICAMDPMGFGPVIAQNGVAYSHLILPC